MKKNFYQYILSETFNSDNATLFQIKQHIIFYEYHNSKKLNLSRFLQSFSYPNTHDIMGFSAFRGAIFFNPNSCDIFMWEIEYPHSYMLGLLDRYASLLNKYPNKGYEKIYDFTYSSTNYNMIKCFPFSFDKKLYIQIKKEQLKNIDDWQNWQDRLMVLDNVWNCLLSGNNCYI